MREAGFSAREKLIVSVDDEMIEKLRAELPQEEEDPMEVLRRQVEEEKKSMLGTNVGCDPTQATTMEKEFVKADGNCLFNCASLAVEGTVDKPSEMRQLTASIMVSNPEKYSRDELGKDPQQYIEWLTSGPQAWGGIPELKALSDLYSIEIGCVVIQDVEVLLFGHK